MRLRVGSVKLRVGSTRLFRYRTNMLVSATRQSRIGGIAQRYISFQCPKLSFYFVHSQGALPTELCTRKLLYAPSQYIATINGSKNVHTPGEHHLKSCTRPWKYARRVQGAPLISDTIKPLLSNLLRYLRPSTQTRCFPNWSSPQNLMIQYHNDSVMGSWYYENYLLNYPDPWSPPDVRVWDDECNRPLGVSGFWRSSSLSSSRKRPFFSFFY